MAYVQKTYLKKQVVAKDPLVINKTVEIFNKHIHTEDQFEVGENTKTSSYTGGATSSIQIISDENKEKCDICGKCLLTTVCERFLKVLVAQYKKVNKVNAVRCSSQNNQAQSAKFSEGSQVNCFYCKKVGHVIKDCRRRIYNNNRAAREQASGNANGASTSGASQSAPNLINQ